MLGGFQGPQMKRGTSASLCQLFSSRPVGFLYLQGSYVEARQAFHKAYKLEASKLGSFLPQLADWFLLKRGWKLIIV